MAEVCPINNLEKILLATDGSEFSSGAVSEAINLAGKCSSRLVAIDIVEANEEYASEAPKLVAKAEAVAVETLASVKTATDSAGINCVTEVHTGDSPYQIIVDEAKKDGSELIIMGRRGRTGFKKVAMGSVTAKVIGHAPCDVLVVPRDGADDYKKILVATDGSPHGEAAAAEAIKMAKKTEGSLIALSVASSDNKQNEAEEAVLKVRQMAEAGGIACETLVSTGKNYIEIVEKAKEKNASLIVVGCHGRTGLGRLLMGSVTERVIGHAHCAVLVTLVS
ncbi:MAG: universal stress protein [Thermoleophilia bacterium]